MALSYRHGCNQRSEVPTDARSNQNAINAVFFDGHVSRLGDRESRELKFWYPKGARRFASSDSYMLRMEVGDVIP